MRKGLNASPIDGDLHSRSIGWPRIPFSVPYVSCFICVTRPYFFCGVVPAKRNCGQRDLGGERAAPDLSSVVAAPAVARISGCRNGGHARWKRLYWRALETNLLYNALNLIEVLVSAVLLRGKFTELPRFTDRRYLMRFVGSAVLAGPAVAGSILALVLWSWKHADPLQTFLAGW